MAHSCVDCQGDIRTPWDGEMATDDEVHTCNGCGYPVCWDCRQMDVDGEDYCETCADALEAKNPKAFDHEAT